LYRWNRKCSGSGEGFFLAENAENAESAVSRQSSVCSGHSCAFAGSSRLIARRFSAPSARNPIYNHQPAVGNCRARSGSSRLIACRFSASSAPSASNPSGSHHPVVGNSCAFPGSSRLVADSFSAPSGQLLCTLWQLAARGSPLFPRFEKSLSAMRVIFVSLPETKKHVSRVGKNYYHHRSFRCR
jgi:hypothetical protein